MAHAAVNRLAHEANGACGDLGTFLPYAVGAVTVGGLGAVGVFFGFGLALIAAGLFYGVPMAVQPMKAVSAALLTSGLSPAEVAMAGLLIGAVFLVLGLSGGVGWVARRIPRSVTLGLVLGLGLAMMWLGVRLMADAPWLGLAALAFAVAAMFVTRVPLLALGVVAVLIAPWLGATESVPTLAGLSWSLPQVALPSWSDLPRALELAVLPQIPLTLSNAIIVTAAVSATLFHEQAARVTERKLSLTTGLGNLALAPLGALPMCHGAGGVVAQHRFGARSCCAPVLLGALLLFAALFAGESAAALLAGFPLPIAGALLVIAGADLGFSKRLIETRPDCWPVIGLTATVAVAFNPAWALVIGIGMEAARCRIARARLPR
ncbi:MAG: putative sulfate/molybdate transporter [Zoogloeaceae bacterium]|nr:putative sulfate/molybdate transporter [Zoogloeaceae bacterium]